MTINLDAGVAVSPALAEELEQLNQQQLEAVLRAGNAVVLAGPGSGKTRTLAAKIAYLLETSIGPRRAIAAITYTRAASREIVDRVRHLGLEPGSQLVCNTLHGWCMSAILQPYGSLAGVGCPDDGKVIDDSSDEWIGLLQKCFDAVGLSERPASKKARVNKLRREIHAGVVQGEQKDPMVAASRIFDEQLMAAGMWDFDSMVARSLQIVRTNPTIARLIAARYPWIIVDEYQDLGPVLHELVLTLRQTGQTNVAAFGDPDQTMMEFTGADPRFLLELSMSDGFKPPIELQINYRCGRAIIAASHTALDSARDHHPDPARHDDGIVEPIEIAGGLDAHAARMMEKVGELHEAGVPLHEIAVFYPGKGLVLDTVLKALQHSDFDFHHERDERIPQGELADFVRDCATRTVAGPQPAGYDSTADAVVIPTVDQLVHDYMRLARAIDLRPSRREIRRGLMNALGNRNPQLLLETWLSELTHQLRLDDIANANNDFRNSLALAAYRAIAANDHPTLQEIAAGGVRGGKITVTTYHSAKGREWPFVILPGLVDGLFPRRWANNCTLSNHPNYNQDRRAFYVGITRAKSAVILIYGDHWSANGCYFTPGISPFVRDVLAHLDQIEA